MENVQKSAFKIILQEHYKNYQQACTHLSALTLAERRYNLCLKFAKKNLKSENSFFTKLEPKSNTRNSRNIVQIPRCNFKRYENSSIPYLARILNHNKKNLKWFHAIIYLLPVDDRNWAQQMVLVHFLDHKFVMPSFLPLENCPQINK